MPLDGLRAWIGEVERKLGVRTRVFLVLTVIAIGGAGAGIYLAIDARDNSVSESDVQALQERLEARTGASGGGGQAQLEAELETLRAQVEKLTGEGGGSGTSSGASGGGSGGGASGSGDSGSGGGGSAGGSGGASAEGTNDGASGGVGSAKLRELLEHAKEKGEAGE